MGSFFSLTVCKHGSANDTRFLGRVFSSGVYARGFFKAFSNFSFASLASATKALASY
jgi:hypothetical protein